MWKTVDQLLILQRCIAPPLPPLLGSLPFSPKKILMMVVCQQATPLFKYTKVAQVVQTCGRIRQPELCNISHCLKSEWRCCGISPQCPQPHPIHVLPCSKSRLPATPCLLITAYVSEACSPALNRPVIPMQPWFHLQLLV